MKERFLSKQYLEATDNEKKMMWLNLFILVFCYIGALLLIHKSIDKDKYNSEEFDEDFDNF